MRDCHRPRENIVNIAGNGFGHLLTRSLHQRLQLGHNWNNCGWIFHDLVHVASDRTTSLSDCLEAKAGDSMFCTKVQTANFSTNSEALVIDWPAFTTKEEKFEVFVARAITDGCHGNFVWEGDQRTSCNTVASKERMKRQVKARMQFSIWHGAKPNVLVHIKVGGEQVSVFHLAWPSTLSESVHRIIEDGVHVDNAPLGKTNSEWSTRA